ncbi:MAG TPA: glycosyltransferase family 2 protein [Methylomirabilota bacterium]|nr:glycosyltransferase family 2 protein [Methylomirabilota bacterium]
MGSPLMDVVIVVPAFNEATTVADVVASVRVHAPTLVVDDGSTDETALRAAAAGAEVIRHPARRGKGAALATGFAAARAKGVSLAVTLDADGQHDPADVPALLTAARATPRAIVIGARPDAALPRGRALAIHLASFWMNWITGVAVADTQSGFRVYPLGLFDAVPLRGGRFVFETAVLVEALRRGWVVREMPIRGVPYAMRQSRFHPIGDGVAITTYLVAHGLARWRVELVAGMREFLKIFSREHRTARHARMLGKASGHAGSPTWGPAIGAAAMDEIHNKLAGWRKHPRARRAARAALATLASPALLLAVAVAAAMRRPLPMALDRLARQIFDQRALPVITPAVDPAHADDTPTWAAVTR